jgi:hypothetical protein
LFITIYGVLKKVRFFKTPHYTPIESPDLSACGKNTTPTRIILAAGIFSTPIFCFGNKSGW